MKLQSLFKKCVPVFGLLFFVGVVWILKQELSQYNLADIIVSLSTIDKHKLNLAILLTFMGYFVISHYDKVAFAAIKYRLQTIKILTTAFISYGISNNTGFALLIGGGIRSYIYSSYRVPKKNITKVIAFSNFNFWLGLLAVGGITFTIDPIPIPQLLQIHFLTVRPLGIIFITLLSIYLYFSWQQKSITIKGEKLVIPSLFTSLSLIIISILDRAIASSVLYLLLPSNTNISYSSFFSIYVLGITAGIMSNIPGGLGVFETVILYLLPKQVSSSDILASLLAYRAIYFLLPLFTALILLGCYEIKKRIFN